MSVSVFSSVGQNNDSGQSNEDTRILLSLFVSMFVCLDLRDFLFVIFSLLSFFFLVLLGSFSLSLGGWGWQVAGERTQRPGNEGHSESPSIK
jgi:hypothetical protein